MAVILTSPVVAQPTPPPASEIEIGGPVLTVTDLDRSLNFYTNILGLHVGTRIPGSPGPGATVTAREGSDAPFLLLRQQAAETGKPAAFQVGTGLSRIMLVVPDVAAAATRLDAKGYAHTPISAHHVFFVNDPDGYRFEIIQRTSRH
ncbi:MAG: VOC family protein [Novosphingobium sp.]